MCPSNILLLLDNFSSPIENAEFLSYGPLYLNLLEVAFAYKLRLIRIYLSSLGNPILPPANPLLSTLTTPKRTNHRALYSRPHLSPDCKPGSRPVAKEHIVLVQL